MTASNFMFFVNRDNVFFMKLFSVVKEMAHEIKYNSIINGLNDVTIL